MEVRTARGPALSIPSKSPLSRNHHLPSTSPEVTRILLRLSRTSLISLALQWLDPVQEAQCKPVLTSDDTGNEDGPYEAARSMEELRGIYTDLSKRKGGKREIVDRIVEGDWRNGITLHQLATAEVRFLLDHPSSQNWNALTLHPCSSGNESADSHGSHGPHFHAPSVVRALHRALGPTFKAHIYHTHVSSLKATILRARIHDSPHNSRRSLVTPLPARPASTEPLRSVFLVFPDATPFVYVAAGGSGGTAGSDTQSARSIILETIPKAVSKPGVRYTLRPTSLTSRKLGTLLQLRGNERGNSAAGRWSVYANDSFTGNLLDLVPDAPSATHPVNDDNRSKPKDDDDKENHDLELSIGKRLSSDRFKETPSPASKRRKVVAAGRFGDSALPQDGLGLEKLTVRIEDQIAGSKTSDFRTGAAGGTRELSLPASPPRITLSFRGSHVFAGIRRLVEEGIVDGDRMPGWMTGQEGASWGIVQGRLRCAG